MKSAQVDTGRRSRARALGMRFVRKLIWMLIVLWGITVVSFFVIHLAPGTPTDMQVSLNPLAGDTVRERLNALYGLDRPLAVQYMDWLNRLVHLDFGHSLSSDGRPVIEKIAERLPLTVGMNVATLLLTLLIAVPVGVVSAARLWRYRPASSSSGMSRRVSSRPQPCSSEAMARISPVLTFITMPTARFCTSCSCTAFSRCFSR